MTGQTQEREAIRKLKNGDITGLEVLVRKYQLQAIRAADLITRDRALAEDIVQAVFIRAYERIGQFNEDLSFGPWFLRSVINEAVKVVTRKQDLVSLGQSARDITEEFLISNEPNPEDHMATQEIQEQVWDALGQLSPEQRAVVVMHYYLELSLEEISEEIAAPPGTVKWRLHKARAHLRKILEWMNNYE